jgi:GH25 family lysozyme M1 (1,4-beta-N-acetylmuramidase)
MGISRWLGAIGCGVLAATACASPSSTDPVGSSSAAVTTCNGGPVVHGVDVSDGQGAIDWVAVKASGIDFALMKATQGNYNVQSSFGANWSGAAHAGVIRGAYHFFDPTVDGVAQAKYFLGVVRPMGAGDLPPMLDIECPSGDSACLGWAGGSGDEPPAVITSRMWDWIHTVQSATGKKPIIYSYTSWFADSGIDTAGLQAYPLNDAYPVAGNCVDVPAPWSQATIWQNSWWGTVSGIAGQVDLDEFLGTLTNLRTFAGETVKPPPHPPAPTVCGAMKPGQGLEAGHSLSSCNGRFTLAMQGDGNLVLYLDGTHALWASNTAGRGGVVVVMQTDGNLVVYDADDSPVWSDGKAGNAGASLAMQDDGNVVEYSTASKVLWATGTNVPVLPKPTGCGAMTSGQALQQGESLGSCDGTHMLVMQTDGNLVLYHSGKALWESNTSGTTAYTAEMQSDGNFVLYDAEHAPLWSSGTQGNGGAHLAMQDDGNLVVYASGGRALWASGTNGQ